jgi:glycosyltransferase involved in cell wall biosynthesis
MSVNDAPRVSVLMAVRNEEHYVDGAVESLLAQTLADFELVVVDDASTDATPALLEAWARRDTRVVVIRSEERLWTAAALNLGLARCRAPLVARADGDDLYAPERLELQVQFLDGHPEVGVVSCAYHRMDPNGEVFDTKRPPVSDAVIRLRSLFMNSLLHPGVIFRADVVRAVGGYDPAYWTAQDADLWARLLPHTRFANLPEPLVTYRVHDRSTMRSRGAAGQSLSRSIPRRLLSAYLGRELGGGRRPTPPSRSTRGSSGWMRPTCPAPSTPSATFVGWRGAGSLGERCGLWSARRCARSSARLRGRWSEEQSEYWSPK